MSLNSSHLMDQIHDLISTLFKNTAEKNRMNLADQANYLEDLFGDIFNALYGYQAVNINQGKANEQAVDLIDEKNKIMVQVTSRQSGFSVKKTKTVKGFLAQSDYNSFKKLYILFLTDCHIDSKHLNKTNIRKGCEYEGIDKNKLLNKIKSVPVLKKETVLKLLLEEMQNRKPVSIESEIDINQLKIALGADLKKFLSMKYLANTNKSEMPLLLSRQVKRYNQEIKVSIKDLEQTAEDEIKDQEGIVGQLPALMLSEKPTFLFGEMGSGKSTMVAEYFWRQNENTDGINLLIPANLIKGNITEQTTSVLQLLTSFLNDHLLISCNQQQITILLKEKVITLGFDGIDELAISEARNLVIHLTKLTDSFSNLSVIATGRPIELSNVVNRNEWNCLSTIDLSLAEMTSLLINESIAEGRTVQEAKADAAKRIAYIKTRTDLLTLAVTPMVLTMIRDHLTEQSDKLSLGDILYKVIKAKLSWDKNDLKKSANAFFEAFPSVFQREKFAAALAEALYNSEDRSISEEALYLVCARLVADNSITGNKLSSDVSEYLKSTFLQKANDRYSFISQPLLDTAYGIFLSEHLFDVPPTFDFCALNWRAISIAAAVIRLRNETSKYRQYFITLLNAFLIAENKTTQSAVIVQEFRDSGLAAQYIELLKPLKFRPLKTWKDEDTNLIAANSFAPIAIANAIGLAGKSGYEWLFSEYLNLRHPLNSHETGLSANLLLFFLIRRNFSLDEPETEALRKIARYTCYYRTFASTDILPVISLLIPGEFQPALRARLLLVMLKKDAAAERAGELIQQLVKDHGELPLLEAIEVYAQETGSNPKSEIIKLWYKYHQGDAMNDAIFKGTISAIVYGDDQLMDLLIAKAGRERIFQYLKFLCLIDAPRSDESAILLFEFFGLSDFYLVARPIMLFSEWHHGKDQRRKRILNNILFEGANPAAKLVKSIEFSGKEIPLLAYEFLIKSFIFLEEDYTGYFGYSLRLFPKFSLTRNPELRDSISRLLREKPVYFDTLRNLALALDNTLRRNAQQIMISCMPGSCAPELLAMVRGSLDRLPPGDEWLGFVNKLDFNKTVLDQLYQVLNTLNPWGKTFAMVILYRNKYALNAQEIEDLARMLMGKGRFYDVNMRAAPYIRILEDPVFVPLLQKVMHADQFNEYENAASQIYSHHQQSVSEQDMLYASVLQAQQHAFFYLYEFANRYSSRFSDTEFLKKLQSAADKAKSVLGIEQTSAEILLKAFQGSHTHWVALLEFMFFERGRFEEMMYHGLYAWLMFLRKTHPELSLAAGKASLEIAKVQVHTPGFSDKSTKGVFLLLAHEFYQADTCDLKEVLSGHKIDKELFPALAVRADQPAPGTEAEPFRNSIYPLFKENKSTTIHSFTPEEIAPYLATGIGMPIDFGQFMRSVVYYGSIGMAELKQQQIKPTGKVLSVIFGFLSHSQIDFEPLLEMMGQAEQREIFADFKGIFKLLKEIRLQQPAGREIYAQELKNRIRINRRHFLAELELFYIELFEMKVPLEFELFQILIEEIIGRQYILQMDLLYLISEHIAEDISAAEHEKIADLMYIYITSTLAFSDEAHEKDYYHVQWLFALIYLYIKKATDPSVTYCFLMGMQALFIQDSRIGHQNKPGYLSQFKGRDLVNHSAILFEKLPETVVQDILKVGLTIDIPEIRVVCRLLRNFHLIKEK